MTAQLIDGKAIAAQVRREVEEGVAAFVAAGQPAPGLAVVLVGEDPASEVYVENKVRQTEAVGMRSQRYVLPANTSENDLLALIKQLNNDESVNGILVQFPLPPQIDVANVISAIDPGKDVDGFNPLNVGRLAAGLDGGLTPCTPLGVMRLIRSVHEDIAGLGVLVVGASNVVGRPLARLLLQAQCTVSIAHIRTTDLEKRCREADILVVATGVPGLIRGDFIKPGATVIDVGISRVRLPNGKDKLTGDVAFEEAVKVAGAITPVPGGVGPMTIAYLLANTLQAAKASAGLS
ncbi:MULTISPECIES: bifunctional methylenetetrahydrofolate dehydrogenase/methenyltetrahydrofolate cyclohydrolase FolD [Pseudomonas]|uniref:bifunctional methylenetetrahydrofolate dehydrogenase/methenyltetrahydrofolate cyclohydrolase FolD n=1 Tax=Pseudomonas TaxID=286 RepID=UPI000C87FAC9|nr:MULTISPECIES: bifunctional methylenetetrahydrofolate dehydrogenase/methenyltetrahydrofolate cyclohydrolase FolD [Pseudomonas]MDR6581688.1 methylenetetrahydrofolate dehydrogenase (NADP+)/methenyltetrahydrofolate cyclohydrolase [Pseudomonas extremaustralis]PMX27635.1 bifunctional methylenetetrahydrofolate dehydrogenase/methenyltetrahydrofolate cyclohydrolase FolD [Pseudomonas sp. GW460-12]PMX35578.1 bifunctional methylenetetrahydrofolate dehydrogenase/methenyltetrahydrofolate cyclohydrolase Fol